MVCEFCGTEFEQKTGIRGRKRKYCTDACRIKAKQEKAKQTPRKRTKKIHHNVCQHCKVEFNGRKKKFCSFECRDYHYKRVVRAIEPMEEHRKRKRRESKHIEERRCEHCDAFFVYSPGGTNLRTGSGGRFCCMDCCLEYRRKKNAEERPRYSKVKFTHCVVCGQWMRKSRRSMCSDACAETRDEQLRELAKHYARERNKEIRSKFLVEINCKFCRKAFTPEYGSKRTVFCSDICNKKYNRKVNPSCHRGRARKYGVEYEPISTEKVLERDSYTCMICGIKTPKSLRGKNKDRSPELDHRIPLSKGGGHTWDNVQCVCRRCNMAKGNTSCAGQMILFNDVG